MSDTFLGHPIEEEAKEPYLHVEVYIYERYADGTVSQSELAKTHDLPLNGHWAHCLLEKGPHGAVEYLRAQIRNVPKHLDVDISHAGETYVEDRIGPWCKIVYEKRE